MFPLLTAVRIGAAATAAAAASPALLRAAARWAPSASGAPQVVPPQLGPTWVAHGFSTGPSGTPQQQQGQQQSDVPPLSKSFVAGKLSQEELWMAGLPGKLKIWSARTRPQLTVGWVGGARPTPGLRGPWWLLCVTRAHMWLSKAVAASVPDAATLHPAHPASSHPFAWPSHQGRETEVVDEVGTWGVGARGRGGDSSVR